MKQNKPDHIKPVEPPKQPPIVLSATGTANPDRLIEVLVAAALDILQREQVELAHASTNKKAA